MMSSSWLIRALCKWKVLNTVLATLGCSCQRLHTLLILAMYVPMLQYYDERKPFKLSSDVSKDGIIEALLQATDGQLMPVAYA